jgi:hypothetical protein
MKTKLNTEKGKSQIEITPKVTSLKGSFKVPSNFNYKKKLAEGLSKKYLHLIIYKIKSVFKKLECLPNTIF